MLRLPAKRINQYTAEIGKEASGQQKRKRKIEKRQLRYAAKKRIPSQVRSDVDIDQSRANIHWLERPQYAHQAKAACISTAAVRQRVAPHQHFQTRLDGMLSKTILAAILSTRCRARAPSKRQEPSDKIECRLKT